MTFQEYVEDFEKPNSHSQYYGQYVNGMIKFVIGSFMGHMIEKSTAENFNDIPRKEWEKHGKMLANLVNKKLVEKNEQEEISLYFLIGVAKEAARQIKKGE